MKRLYGCLTCKRDSFTATNKSPIRHRIKITKPIVLAFTGYEEVCQEEKENHTFPPLVAIFLFKEVNGMVKFAQTDSETSDQNLSGTLVEGRPRDLVNSNYLASFHLILTFDGGKI